MMSRNKSHVFPCVLKTIIRDAHNDTKTFSLNDKQIRSRLRAKIATHMKNTSWVANNQREYDAIRCAFDVAYANRIANARKRTSRKSTRKSNDANNDATTTTTNDANA